MKLEGEGIKYLREHYIPTMEIPIGVRNEDISRYARFRNCHFISTNSGSGYWVYLHSQRNSDRMIGVFRDPRLYLDLTTWNVVLHGTWKGYSVIMTNVKYIFSQMRYVPTDDELKVCVETSLLTGRDIMACLNDIAVGQSRGSIIGTVVKQRQNESGEGINEFEELFNKEADAFRQAIATIEAYVASESWEKAVIKELATLTDFSEGHFVKDPVYSDEMRVRGLHKLLRTIGKDYSFLYLKVAPSLFSKYPEKFGLDKAPYHSDLVRALRDFAYNGTYHNLFTEFGVRGHTEDFRDLGSLSRRFERVDTK